MLTSDGDEYPHLAFLKAFDDKKHEAGIRHGQTMVVNTVMTRADPHHKQ